MFVLIWITLLLSVRCSIADADGYCHNGSCITISEANLTAEVGLCVVVPCSFTTNHSFTPESLTWYKFPSEENRNDSQIIFSSSSTNPNVQTEYRGRVSLLEPDLNNMSCSIIINDLTKSDSGSYQVRVKSGLSGAMKEYTSSTRTLIIVKDLSQKPTVMVPPLTEGQQTTLTCTAPGLCSGSVPTITWMWRGSGDNTTEITGNLTERKTENLTAETQGHSSTLTINASAEHHGTQVTCKVGFTGDTATEETVTLNVTYVKDLELNGSTAVEEGWVLNLTCSRKSFPPSLIIWTKLGTNKEIEMMNDTETASLVIPNMNVEHSGEYICKAIHLNKNQTKGVNVTVKYVKPRITGKTTVTEGHALNLTCSFPSSAITWTKLGSNKTLNNGTGTATLVIPDVTTDHSGEYICTAKHLNNTLTTNVTVALLPKVQNTSGCEVHSGVLTCVCISKGYPLPTIKWPLLENNTDYSVNTTVLNHTVKSTVIFTLQDHNNTAVECVSSNKNGEAKRNLVILKKEQQEGQTIAWLTTVTRLDIIIAFFIGGLISATFCCFGIKCHRKKQSTHRPLDETLEMVTSQEDQLIHAGEEVEEVAEEGAAGKSDVEYSHINLSLLKRNNATKVGNNQETAETEYAEVKKKKVHVEVDGESKGEEVMIEENEDTNHIQEEKEGEEEALYSSVKDIMD